MNEYSGFGKSFSLSEKFTRQVEPALKSSAACDFVLVSLDFDNFNYINDVFGYDLGDKILKCIENIFSENMCKDECFTHVYADFFMLWLKHGGKMDTGNRLINMIDNSEQLKQLVPEHYKMVCSGGIIKIAEPSDNLSAMIDKANVARKRAKGNHTSRFLYFDDKMSQDIDWKKRITLSSVKALEDGEFEMYLQPKVNIKTNEIVGAEALARWNSKEYGMVCPDRFIAAFEQNGFIKQIDFLMLDKACEFLAECIKNKDAVLPISVNFSKIHAILPSFVKTVFETAERHNISTNLIEIEFTESVFTEDSQALINISNDLKCLGFKVVIDDFGKAYSALNYLKDIPLDIIKIDKGFLDNIVNAEKGKIVISKVIELVKCLQLTTVMEGVETKEQVELLQRLSCDLAQGFFYSEPLPVSEYLNFIRTNKCAEIAGVGSYIQNKSFETAVAQEFQMDNWELYILGKNIDMGLIKGYLSDDATVQYINDCALNYFGYTREEFRLVCNNNMAALLRQEDSKKMLKNIRQLIKTGAPIKFKIGAIRKDGKEIILQGRASCVRDEFARPIGLFAFQDVTEDIKRNEALKKDLEDKITELEKLILAEKQNTEALRLSEERYRLIVSQNDDIVFEWDFEKDHIEFSGKFNKIFGRPPVEDNLSRNKQVRDAIHPHDGDAYEKWIKATYRKRSNTKAEFRIKNSKNEYVWIRIKSTPICDSNGVPIKAIGTVENINADKTERNMLAMKAKLDPLTGLYNKEEFKTLAESYIANKKVTSAAFLIVDVDNFKAVNDNLGHQIGDSYLVDVAKAFKAIFRESDIIGRLGGDEFFVFMCDVTNHDIVLEKAALIKDAFRKSYYGENNKVDVSASIGIAYYPQNARTYSNLYRMADNALYYAKRNGKDACVVYQNNIKRDGTTSESPIDYSENFLTNFFAGDPVFNVFEMLYESKNIEATINELLGTLGKKFDVDRVYIFQHNQDRTLTSNTYEWCAKGVVPQKNNLQNLEVEDFNSLFSAYNPQGVLCSDDISQFSGDTYDVLSQQGIASLVHCAISDNGKMVGFIGFDECRKKRAWRGDEVATLAYISRVLSVFMIKNKLTTDLFSSYGNYVEMLDNLNGFVYVIDRKNYELLYINNPVKALGAKIGDKCHKMAFKKDTPCANCPVKKLSAEVNSNTEEIYSALLDAWVSSAASKLKWNNQIDAALVCCTDITKYKK